MTLFTRPLAVAPSGQAYHVTLIAVLGTSSRAPRLPCQSPARCPPNKSKKYTNSHNSGEAGSPFQEVLALPFSPLFSPFTEDDVNFNIEARHDAIQDEHADNASFSSSTAVPQIAASHVHDPQEKSYIPRNDIQRRIIRVTVHQTDTSNGSYFVASPSQIAEKIAEQLGLPVSKGMTTIENMLSNERLASLKPFLKQKGKLMSEMGARASQLPGRLNHRLVVDNIQEFVDAVFDHFKSRSQARENATKLLMLWMTHSTTNHPRQRLLKLSGVSLCSERQVARVKRMSGLKEMVQLFFALL